MKFRQKKLFQPCIHTSIELRSKFENNFRDLFGSGMKKNLPGKLVEKEKKNGNRKNC